MLWVTATLKQNKSGNLVQSLCENKFELSKFQLNLKSKSPLVLIRGPRGNLFQAKQRVIEYTVCKASFSKIV